MKYKIAGKIYEESITIRELYEDLKKNEKIIKVLDMKKAEVIEVEELNAEDLVENL